MPAVERLLETNEHGKDWHSISVRFGGIEMSQDLGIRLPIDM